MLDGLVQLTEHNLLSRVDDAVGGVRFGCLVTIRGYALERLIASGERPIIEARHTRAFASLASEAAAHLPGGKQAWWLDRLAVDDANLRAATRRAIASSDVEHALTIVGFSLVVGVPLGLVVGKQIWLPIANTAHVVPLSIRPWAGIATVVAIGLLATALLALPAAWRTLRLRPADTLRAE